MLTTYDKTMRVISYALGEDFWDRQETVTDIISGYAEPGYGDNDSVVVLGNWNNHRAPKDREMSKREQLQHSLPSRLADSLERIGANIEWLDEWAQCQGCYRAVRTQSDSYVWKPFSDVIVDEFLCGDCLTDMGEDALEEYVNNSNKAITWANASHLESLGFVRYAPGNEHDYAHGWFLGQNDNPVTILAEIQRDMPKHDVVFLIDSTGQFDIHFGAYVRPVE